MFQPEMMELGIWKAGQRVKWQAYMATVAGLVGG
jgi:hypothetical protein